MMISAVVSQAWSVVLRARAVPSIRTSHFVQGKRLISRSIEGFGEGPRKIYLQQVPCLLAKQNGIHLTREGERPDTAPKYLSAGNATPGLQAVTPTQCTSSLWGVGIAGCAANHSGIGSPEFEKRHVFWYATCMVTELMA